MNYWHIYIFNFFLVTQAMVLVLNKYIYYQESKYVLMHTPLLTRKFKEKTINSFFFGKQQYELKNVLVLLPNKKTVRLNNFAYNYYVYWSYFKLQGIGYKMAQNTNLMVLKIGYSHLITFFLHLEIQIIKKTKTLFSLRSHSKFILNTVASFVKTIKIPNVYTGKGIRKKFDVLRLKKGKVSQL